MNSRSLSGYIILTLSVMLIITFWVALKNIADTSEHASTFQMGMFTGIFIGIVIQAIIAMLLFRLRKKAIKKPKTIRTANV